MIAFDGTDYMHSQAGAATKNTHSGGSSRVFRMEKGERTAGSVPVWSPQKTPAEQVAGRLAAAERAGGDPRTAVDGAIAYSPLPEAAKDREEFTFGDLVDMVNPLHHIPVVGSIYREISGDDIKPVSRIVGGAVFGGAAGAASGLVNLIVEEETGRDLTGNVMSLAFRDEENGPTADRPQKRLDRAAKRLARYGVSASDLPGTTVAFADLGTSRSAIEKTAAAGGRTAGNMIKQKELHYEYVMPHEPVTEISFSDMP